MRIADLEGRRVRPFDLGAGKLAPLSHARCGMKIKYTGGLDAVRLRHVTFEKGKAVDFDMDDKADALLSEKVRALPDFEEVKPGRKPKNDQDSE